MMGAAASPARPVRSKPKDFLDDEEDDDDDDENEDNNAARSKGQNHIQFCVYGYFFIEAASFYSEKNVIHFK